jgi:hypothetical protein
VITYNLNDYNLEKIQEINEKFFSGRISRRKGLEYRVYGLRQENNPAVSLEPFNPNNGNTFIPSDSKSEALERWMRRHEIVFEVFDTDLDRVKIGLRRDIRRYPKFCAALVRTIVLFCENKLDLTGTIPENKMPKPKNKKKKGKK